MSKSFPGVVKKKGVMNTTESEYAFMLEMLKRGGKIVDYMYEPFRFMLAHKDKRLSYCPDFLVVLETHVEIHEVKGGQPIKEAGNIKFKVAADKFPWFKWKMIQKKTKQGWVMIREY